MWNRFLSSTTYPTLHGFLHNYSLIRLAHLMFIFVLSLVIPLLWVCNFNRWAESSLGMCILLTFTFQCIKSDAISLVLAYGRVNLFLNHKPRISKVIRYISSPSLKEVFIPWIFIFFVIEPGIVLALTFEVSKVATLECSLSIAKHTLVLVFTPILTTIWIWFLSKARFVIHNLSTKLWGFICTTGSKTFCLRWLVSILLAEFQSLIFCSLSFEFFLQIFYLFLILISLFI